MPGAPYPTIDLPWRLTSIRKSSSFHFVCFTWSAKPAYDSMRVNPRRPRGRARPATRSVTGFDASSAMPDVDAQRPSVRRQLFDVEHRQIVRGEDRLDA